MRHLIPLVLSAALALGGCQQVGEGGRNVADKAETAIEETKQAIKDVLYYKPKDEEYKPIPYSFCYEVMQDINCYNQPLPDARGRLVGWQGRGEFRIEDTSRLPAKTALVRQPRKAERRSKLQEIIEPEDKKEEKPQIVSLEPVFIPEQPKPKSDKEKTVTIKVSEPDSSTLY